VACEYSSGYYATCECSTGYYVTCECSSGYYVTCECSSGYYARLVCYSGCSATCECNRNSYAKCLLFRWGIIVALLLYALHECDPVELWGVSVTEVATSGVGTRPCRVKVTCADWINAERSNTANWIRAEPVLNFRC